MTQPLASGKSARFDLNEIAKSFPPSADTLLLDTYLTNEDAASSRVFRAYRPTPPHYHATCDEYLYVLSGRGTFWMETAENGGTFGPGHLLFFRRGVVHALPDIIEGPVLPVGRHAPPRSPRYHLRQSGGRHAGELHSWALTQEANSFSSIMPSATPTMCSQLSSSDAISS